MSSNAPSSLHAAALSTSICRRRKTRRFPAGRPGGGKSDAEPEFLTEAELQRRERENLLIILEKAHWKIKGGDGAAELLGVNAATLLSRMKKMGLKRPASV